MRSRRTWAVVAALVVGLLPLLVVVVLDEDKLEGFGLGFVLSGAWLLLLALVAQALRARRERRTAAVFPGPAGRRHDATAVADALVAVAPADWVGLRLEVDDAGRRAVVTRPGGRREPLTTDSPALHAAIDQLDASTGRTRASMHRLVLAASRDGTARITVE